jgi:hypothetical protein
MTLLYYNISVGLYCILYVLLHVYKTSQARISIVLLDLLLAIVSFCLISTLDTICYLLESAKIIQLQYLQLVTIVDSVLFHLVLRKRDKKHK